MSVTSNRRSISTEGGRQRGGLFIGGRFGGRAFRSPGQEHRAALNARGDLGSLEREIRLEIKPLPLEHSGEHGVGRDPGKDGANQRHHEGGPSERVESRGGCGAQAAELFDEDGLTSGFAVTLGDELPIEFIVRDEAETGE